MGAVCSCIPNDGDDQEVNIREKKSSVDLEQQAKDFVTTRKVHDRDSEEGKFRLENVKEIQNKRWQWYKDNAELFSLVLKNNGFDEEDIKQSIAGTKPLGMKNDFYDEFKVLLGTAVKDATQRIKAEYPELGKIRIILQGSYTVGFSTNPRKGDRYIPNYLFLPLNKSDYDFRCYAYHLDEYVERLRKDGVEIFDRAVNGAPHVIHFKSINDIFPEFTKLLEEFQEMSKKHLGESVRLQISLSTKNIDFEPNPWDFELEFDSFIE